MKPLAIVTGVGPGTGTSIARRFAEGGYRVALLARNAERLNALAAELPDSVARPVDVADETALNETLADLQQEFGPPKTVVHNAVGGAFGDFLAVEPKVLEQNFQVNVMALMHLARAVAPAMVANGGGALIVTRQHLRLAGPRQFRRLRADQGGAAHSRRSDRAADGAAGASRRLSGDRRGDRPRLDARAFKGQKDEFFIKPGAIAAEVWHLAHQDRSAWSLLHEIRPFGEAW